MTQPTASDAFARAYLAATALIEATPQLMGFSGWPRASLTALPATPTPAAQILKAWAEGHSDATRPLRDAVQSIADLVDWRLRYTETEVGADFLNRYGFFELVGPTGHYHSDEVRAFFAFWGENLYYPWHQHEAEELYFIVAGHALFEADGEEPRVMGPGDICIHGSNQRHAMTTTDSPILALVLWRGAGLDGMSAMSVQ